MSRHRSCRAQRKPAGSSKSTSTSCGRSSRNSAVACIEVVTAYRDGAGALACSGGQKNDRRLPNSIERRFQTGPVPLNRLPQHHHGGGHQKLGLNHKTSLPRRALLARQLGAAEIGARHDPRAIGSCDLRCCLRRSDAGLCDCSSASDRTQVTIVSARSHTDV